MIPGRKYFGLHIPIIVEVCEQTDWLVRHEGMQKGAYKHCSSEAVARADAAYYARLGYTHIEVTSRTVKIMGELL